MVCKNKKPANTHPILSFTCIHSLLFVSQYKHSYIELRGPGKEGSFLSRQRWQGAARKSSLAVGGEDKAIG